MKYSDFLGLHDFFDPVCDLMSEKEGYWKQFIPNPIFEDSLLQSVLKANSDDPSEKRKAVWVRGTYGTGKSHAAIVVKHLLCDDVSEIRPWVSQTLTPMISQKLLSIRKEKKGYLPVVIKGAGTISDARTFAWTLQRAIVSTLREKQHNAHCEEDFDIYLNKLEDASINWEDIIRGSNELRVLVRDKASIRQYLQRRDVSFLAKLAHAVEERGTYFSVGSTKIDTWVSQAVDNVVGLGYKGLLIIWDEFTSVMDSSHAGIINAVQNIAEVAKRKNLILYLISHRVASYSQNAKDEYDKLSDRFYLVHYNMEASTTYHILAKTINPKDKILAARYRNDVQTKNAGLAGVVRALTKHDINSSGAANELISLYPLHPYTAYLCTMMARYMGSSSRSAFEFFYDKDKGFLKFLGTTASASNLCTADTLWDFFEEDLKKDNPSIVSCYTRCISAATNKGNEYLAVFKGILLLNALSMKMTSGDAGFATPSKTNIVNMFIGRFSPSTTEDILRNIHESRLITCDPYGNYAVDTSSLPVREVDDAVEKLKKCGLQLHTILKDKGSKADSIFGDIKDWGQIHRPEDEAIVFGGNASIRDVRGALLRLNSASVYRLLFFCADADQREKCRNLIQDLFNSNQIRENVIPIVYTTLLTEDEERLYFEYAARASVAKKHGNTQEEASSNEMASKILESWLQRVGSGQCEIYISKSRMVRRVASQVSDVILSDCVYKIFPYGFDNFNVTGSIWDVVNAQKLIQYVLKSGSYSQLEDNLKGADSTLKSIFQDENGNPIIQNNSFSFRGDCPGAHPLKVSAEKVKTLLGKQKGKKEFNIATVLEELHDSPFGFYKCKPHIAALSFALSSYIGVLYDSKTGHPIKDALELQEVIVGIFSEWEGKVSNKVHVRFGSKEEDSFRTLIEQVFQIKNTGNTNEMLSLIKFDFQDKKGIPLWVLLPADEKRTPIERVAATLFDFIENAGEQPPSTDDYAKVLQIVSTYQHELRALVQKGREECAQLFKSHLISIHPEKIDHDNVDYIMGVLKGALPGNIASWTPSRVTEETLKAVITLGSKHEANFRSLISEVFSVENGDDTQALITAIRGAKQDRLPAPYWVTYAGMEAQNGMYKAASDLISFIDKSSSTNPSDADYKAIIDSCKPHKEGLRKLFAKPEHEYGRLFRNRLYSINRAAITPDNVRELESYLAQKLPSNKSAWTNENVSKEVRAWLNWKQKIDGIIARLEDDDYTITILLDLLYQILDNESGAMAITESFMKEHDEKLKKRHGQNSRNN